MFESKVDAVERDNWKEGPLEKFMKSRNGSENRKMFVHNELSLRRIARVPVQFLCRGRFNNNLLTG